MAILATTLCYPNPTAPGLGIFVKRRLSAIHARIPIHVVAPVPVFQPLRRRGFAATADTADTPPVHWPTMFYLPAVLKSLDAGFYARALDACIADHPDLAACRLIDAHFVWPDGVGAWQVARRRGLKFVCTIRGKLVSQSRFPARRRKIAEMLRDADRLIAVSQSLANLACDVAQRPLDITVIPNGIDADTYYRSDQTPMRNGGGARRERLGWSASHRYVVAVGHLQRIKGFHRLIEAWPRVIQSCKDARLILVGGSAGQPRYERELRRLVALANASATNTSKPPITFAGRQSPETIRDMLNEASLFALASDCEGWCNAIAEALACGCPVVATDVGGNREIVCDESLGRLVPLDDSRALAETIVDALSRDWDRAAIAVAGGKRTWQQVADECVDVYEALLR